MKEVIRCNRCIMDNSSDSTITFDDMGYCNYCTTALANKSNVYFPNAEGQNMLDEILTKMKEQGKHEKYDCIMGLSGGLDSSYLVYLGHKWGLRVLVVHIDDGFDSDISSSNIKRLIRETGFDCLTIKPDTRQFCDLTKAYMKAGVPNLAVPQDNVLFAFLYDCIKKNGIKYFLSGSNFALESILQRGNTYKSTDVVNISSIHKRFGSVPVVDLRFISTLQMFLDVKIHKIATVCPLNYVNYERDRALQELKDFCGFEYYGRKHLENKLTEFIQLYWFPKKFGVDKRTSHLSSMIVSGQMTREVALLEFAQPLYEEAKMEQTIQLVKDRLVIADEEFGAIMSAPTHQHEDYEMEDDTIVLRALKALLKVKKTLSTRN